MKRSLLLILFLANIFYSSGQTLSVSVPTVTATIGQTVDIPVKLSGAGITGVPISSANIQITYDTAVLTYDTLTSFYSGTPQNQWFFSGQNGLVSANWLEPSLLTLAIPDGTTLYVIRFIKKAGNSPLTFVVNEFTDAAYNLVPTTPVNGAVNALLVYHQVTFKVDMSKENITSNGVYLSGSFNNWSFTQTPMILGANSIYSATVILIENQAYTYRFVNGNSAPGLESVPAACGVLNSTGEFERSLTVPAIDTTLNPVCLGMCTDCPLNVTVTFRVDMQHEALSPNGVHVAGDFNNWNYAQTLLNPAGGSIYETTMILEEGLYQEFRFVNGNTSADAEILPAMCTTNGNRYVTIPGQDTVLTAYCYDSCVACGTVAQYSNVTFSVDMQEVDSISADGVHIAGSFQGWLPGLTAMSTSGDSIYNYTVSLLAGTTVQYKFVNGNASNGYEIVPLSCAVNGNRELPVPFNDTILKLVCFSSCDSCVITGLDDKADRETSQLMQNAPNPCDDYTTITFHVEKPGMVTIDQFDLTGRKIERLFHRPCESGTFMIPLKTNSMNTGIYFYSMTCEGTPGFKQIKKMVVLH